MTRLLETLLGLAVALVVGTYVVASILEDALMLVDAGGWWMLGLYAIVPSLVALHAWRAKL